MSTWLLLLLLISMTACTLSPLEAALICQYDGVTGFPVPCADAANACIYEGIECIVVYSQPLWNETIVELSLSLLFAGAAVPTELGNLASLRSFSLWSDSPLSASTIPTQLALCTHLESLRLGGVLLDGTLPSELFIETNLSYLELGATRLSGTVPPELGLATRLTYLSLFGNRLSGTLPSSLKALTFLNQFSVADNQLSGTLPDLSLLSLLSDYRAANNLFTGNVPGFTSRSLAYVDISHNLLDGTFDTLPIALNTTTPLSYLANANQLIGTLPSGFFTTALITLDLSHNRLSGTIPDTVKTAIALKQIVLSHNLLSGDAWYSGSFPALFRVALNHNLLDGTIPSFYMGAEGNGLFDAHIYIQLNDNSLQGTVPLFLPFVLPASLDFSHNRLTLRDHSFGTGYNVAWLNLANNPIGSLPSALFTTMDTFQELVTLDLSHCELSGTLPEYFYAQYIELNNNYFTGSIGRNFVFQLDADKLPVFVNVQLNRLETDATRTTSIGGASGFFSSELVLTSFPQDVDECLLGTHECESLCLDGWFPVPGYTCGCASGFLLDETNRLNCTAVCGDGLLRWPEEQCDYEYDQFGCHRNCTVEEGYVCDANGCKPICGDGIIMPPEECDNSMPGCSKECKVLDGFTCSLDDNRCQSCSQSWQPFIYTPNLRLFPALRAVIGNDLSDFNFASCIACEDGYALETRAVLAVNQCGNLSTQRSLPCSFACTNLTVFSSASESIYTLQQQLEKNGFLRHIFRLSFNLNVTLNSTVLSNKQKRISGSAPDSHDLEINVAPCVSDKTSLVDVVRALTLDIVPNIPNLLVTATPCGVRVRSTDPPADVIISIVLVIGVTIVLLLIVVAVSLVYYYRSSELHQLPDDISWSFLDQRLRPTAWHYTGSQKSGYYSRLYERGSEDYRKVESLLTTHFKKGNIQIGAITAIYNPTLSTSFCNHHRVMTTRKLESPDLFFARTYTKDEAKMKVMEYVDKDLLQFTPYNQKLAVPIIPVLHGTDYTTAEHIAQTGFATLSTLDEGYFGKGIYFTTSLPYTLMYACAKRRPAVIISYVNLGNVYPVTERHDSPKSFKGAAIKSGYTSHCALTNKRGAVYNDERDDLLCDEFVIPQESQILPAWIVELDIESCTLEFSKWNREVPKPALDGAIKAFQAEQEILNKYTSLDTIISIDGSITGRHALSQEI